MCTYVFENMSIFDHTKKLHGDRIAIIVPFFYFTVFYEMRIYLQKAFKSVMRLLDSSSEITFAPMMSLNYTTQCSIID